MAKTAFLGLPLVQPSQAQKHVTVNEALTRIDALTQLTILSTSLQSPPAATEGDCYFVAPGGVNAWSGQDGTLALYLNGGWDFVSPGIGWHAWLVDLGTPAMFDGVDWIPGTGAISLNGAATTARVIEIDHDLMAGPSSATVPIIPAQSLGHRRHGNSADRDHGRGDHVAARHRWGLARPLWQRAGNCGGIVGAGADIFPAGILCRDTPDDHGRGWRSVRGADTPCGSCDRTHPAARLG